MTDQIPSERFAGAVPGSGPSYGSSATGSSTIRADCAASSGGRRPSIPRRSTSSFAATGGSTGCSAPGVTT
ncbi:hypothetical protein ACFQL4_06355 [Halosimplex aquaticum]